jgi:hypothetical protein
MENSTQSTARPSSHVKRLLDALRLNGRMDAHDLAELTGIQKVIVVATLHSAGSKGQVKMTPKAEAGYVPRCTRTSRATKKGQVYDFIAFEAPAVRHEVETLSPELIEQLESLFMPQARKTLAALDAICERRVHQMH